MTYNDTYELNNTELINNEGVFLFKLKIDNEENGIIKLKIDKEAYPDKEMEIIIVGFIEEPTIDILEKISYYLNMTTLKLDSKYTDEKYSTYVYLYEKIENAKYFVIAVKIEKQMNYFSIYIGPRKSDEQPQNLNESNSLLLILLIILFVVLYTIIILLVFYFILKKCKCCKKDDLSNQITQDFNIQPEN